MWDLGWSDSSLQQQKNKEIQNFGLDTPIFVKFLFFQLSIWNSSSSCNIHLSLKSDLICGSLGSMVAESNGMGLPLQFWVHFRSGIRESHLGTGSMSARPPGCSVTLGKSRTRAQPQRFWKHFFFLIYIWKYKPQSQRQKIEKSTRERAEIIHITTFSYLRFQ